jgi:hypothetical protein
MDGIMNNFRLLEMGVVDTFNNIQRFFEPLAD